eukprot:CAMPEP_0113376682 /NCGR_PEP_ID=MMETSP0013_2-20120614/2758_1 /TAXON_ID=2843 ORGANISM="Skeletonema costatum, Strain 1716" /NCGR_SAMPLE_ID=MMETSP0013_2 /ASSEMBLY_ACC=CAM_ASM_000158 /LENGTH=134 /DNA_ID=CAMNT_0000258777 /DNA_START=836 /DNA_END=1237 /DNA_ORIENTATION=+ /assembly_acc=CAM_ASM_000158
MLWTRGIHWVYLITTLLLAFYRDQAWAFLCLGTVLSLLFSLFNYALCLKPFYKKFVKFLHVSAEYESLPADASADRRRSSVMQLDLARAELQKREVTRRQSVPVLRGGRRGSLLRLQLQQSKSFGYDITKSKDL